MWKPSLRPYIGESQSDVEPFEEWYPRVASAIPGIPQELAEHWLYDNWGALEQNVNYMSLVDINATREMLELSQILEITVQESWKIEPGTAYLDAWVQAHDELALQMAQAGTWPVPIVVLDNEGSVAAPGRPDIGRWHLLEGHRRLTLVNGLAAAGKAQPSHEVWLVKAHASQPAIPPAVTTGNSTSSRGSFRDVRLKFEDAVQRLAVGTGTIQQRLLEVFMGTGLFRVEEARLGDRQEIWGEMREALCRVKDDQRGSIRASIEAMEDREASHRARTIVELSQWLVEQDHLPPPVR